MFPYRPNRAVHRFPLPGVRLPGAAANVVLSACARWAGFRAVAFSIAGPVRGAFASGAAFAVAVLIAALAGCQSETQPELPALGVEEGAVTLSGISAGAYMAGQFQFAHPRLVSGVALVAGGPYGCAESMLGIATPGPGATLLNLTKAINGCMLNGLRHWGEPNVARLADSARARAAAGSIGPVSAVASDRVYLFTGQSDRVVVSEIVKSAAAFYREIGIKSERIRLIEHDEAGHGFITEEVGAECERTRSPYLNDCDYDQAGDILRTLGAARKAPLFEPPAADPEATGGLQTFHQARFTEDLGRHGLADRGLVYVPEACRRRPGCRLHVVFHGCKQNMGNVGERFVREAGFNGWAATNRIVVLYPQVATTTLNSNACWDWWGVTGRDYLTKKAPQIVAVRRMIRQLARPLRRRGR